MKLEVGEFYLTEDGRIIKITENKQKDLFLDSDDYFYNEIGVNEIINTNRNLIAHIPKELHYRICEMIKNYHTDEKAKFHIDNGYINRNEQIIPVINKKRLCNKQGHGFYNAIENKNCPKCKQESNKDYDTTIRSEERKKIYNSKRWKEVRELAILRDEFQCVECKKLGIQTKFEEVDHIVELSDDITLAYDLNNLQCLCKKHHREKTEQEKRKRG